MDSHRLDFFSVLHQHPHRHRWVFFFFTSAVLFLATVIFGWAIQLPSETIAVGVVVGESALGGLDRTEAESKLQEEWKNVPEATVTVQHNETSWQKTSTELQLHLHTSETVNQALTVGRQGTVLEQIMTRIRSHFQQTPIVPTFAYQAEIIDTWVQEIAKEIDVEGRLPQARLSGSRITIDSGKQGQALDTAQLRSLIQSQPGQSLEITAPVEVTIIPLSADGLIAAEQRLEKLRTLKLVLQPSEEEKSITLTAGQFFPWLRLPDGYYVNLMSAGLAELTQSWNREAQEAIFQLNDDKTKVENFVPPLSGRAVALDILVDQIQTAITQYETAEKPENTVTIEVPFQETAIKVSLHEANNLGIRERIGIGTSEFAGSIPNRIHNVALTAKNLHGTLIKPGEEFSFNAAIGDVSQKTGYKQAYIIQNGRTELGDGGGVCQVSTTLFRSLLNAGMPITRWKPHSYRVGYYEQNSQPGFDATVFAPTADLRFVNDTGHHIVVATYPDTENTFLKIELWGTSDGRQATVSNYSMWNQRGAPAPLFVPDPAVAPGARKQIDWAAAGANTKFSYKVTSAEGKVIQERDFVSYFKPWQAVYLVNPISMP